MALRREGEIETGTGLGLAPNASEQRFWLYVERASELLHVMQQNSLTTGFNVCDRCSSKPNLLSQVLLRPSEDSSYLLYFRAEQTVNRLSHICKWLSEPALAWFCGPKYLDLEHTAEDSEAVKPSCLWPVAHATGRNSNQENNLPLSEP